MKKKTKRQKIIIFNKREKVITVIVIILIVIGTYFKNKMVDSNEKEKGKYIVPYQSTLENNNKVVEKTIRMIADNAVLNIIDFEEHERDDINSEESDTDENLSYDNLEDSSKDTSEGETGSELENVLEDKKNNIAEGDNEGNDDETGQDQPVESSIVVAGQNPSEGAALMTYVNQYRIENGVDTLNWNANLEQEAQGLAEYSINSRVLFSYGTYKVIGRRCNGAKSAQKAVADWIVGNYVPSEANTFLDASYTQMGGALYYLPDGNENGFHYFWIICLQ